MGTLTIRISDDKHERLKALAAQRGISVNKLIDELATIALTEQDARTWFEIRAKRGDPKRGLATLDMLDEQCTPSLACALLAADLWVRVRIPYDRRIVADDFCPACASGQQ